MKNGNDQFESWNLTKAIVSSIVTTIESQGKKRSRLGFTERANDPCADVSLRNELERYLAAHFTLDDCDQVRLQAM